MILAGPLLPPAPFSPLPPTLSCFGTLIASDPIPQAPRVTGFEWPRPNGSTGQTVGAGGREQGRSPRAVLCSARGCSSPGPQLLRGGPPPWHRRSVRSPASLVSWRLTIPHWFPPPLPPLTAPSRTPPGFLPRPLQLGSLPLGSHRVSPLPTGTPK